MSPTLPGLHCKSVSTMEPLYLLPEQHSRTCVWWSLGLSVRDTRVGRGEDHRGSQEKDDTDPSGGEHYK